MAVKGKGKECEGEGRQEEGRGGKGKVWELYGRGSEGRSRKEEAKNKRWGKIGNIRKRT